MVPLDPSRGSGRDRIARAERLLHRVFQSAGWRVLREPSSARGGRPDLVVRREAAAYAIELEIGSEGRSDRLIPLWSQAYVQALRSAGDYAPLAIVAAPRIPLRVAEHVLDFVEQHAPHAAAGVIDLSGLRLFRGPHLDDLNARKPLKRHIKDRAASVQPNLFSDLNQWMLKVLLAPELRPDLLSAPRGVYPNASQLARAAGVSVMTAFRFVQQLQRHGYLHEAAAFLRLVRRDDLFRRWQASSIRGPKEAPMRFLLGGSDRRELLARMLSGTDRACLALFAAADALGFGFVEGVPPHVYVRDLAVDLAGWKNIAPAEHGEPPDFILLEARQPESIFRGSVRPRGIASCDVLQVWVDVGSHPSRGREQAEFLHERVLRPLMGADHDE